MGAIVTLAQALLFITVRIKEKTKSELRRFDFDKEIQKGGVTMALVSYRKHRNGLVRLHGEMDDLFDAFFGDWPSCEHRLWPAIDLADEKDSIIVKAEMPGCKAEDIDISVHGNTMTISGEKKQSEEKEQKGYYYSESTYGSFRRQINLPIDVDTSGIEAVCKDGVLTVTLPKAEKAKTVKVKVKG